MERTIVAETDRLYLAEFSTSEASFFFGLNSDTEVMKYTGDTPFDSVGDSKAFLKNYDHYSRFGFGRWTVILKAENRPIGWCGLKNHPEEGYVDLGYRFSRDYWGHGFATEASLSSLNIGFSDYGLDQVVGRTARANDRSVKVLERLGMAFWKNETCEGIEDSVFYRITRKQYDEKVRARFYDRKS